MKKMTEENTRPLRSSHKRETVIRDIEQICQELGIPIEVDLRCFPYGLLLWARIRLELAKKFKEKSCASPKV